MTELDNHDAGALCLLLTTETSSELERTLRLRFEPVRMLPDGELRNYVEGYPDAHTWLADLRITAQQTAGLAEQPYAWRVQYMKPYSVDLERAEIMVKTLRKIARGLERLEAEFGYPESFAAYVTRVGSLLKVKQYGWRAERGETFADGTGYRWTDAAGIVSHVQMVVRDHNKVEGSADVR